jgi:NAD(P)H-dependent FMN reductase
VKVQVILGSTRPGRVSERVARWVAAEANKLADFDAEIVDLQDYELPMLDEAISPRYNPNREPNAVGKRFLDKLGQADGYIIVTPEYNHSISGVLKNALDYTDFQLAKKPVAIVSHGTVGGARAAEHLKGIITETGAAVVPQAIALTHPRVLLDEAGVYQADSEAAHGQDEFLQAMLQELSWWTKTLKAGRNEIVLAG